MNAKLFPATGARTPACRKTKLAAADAVRSKEDWYQPLSYDSAEKPLFKKTE